MNGKQGDQKIGEKNCPNFGKSSQNIYIKAQHESLKHPHQTTVEIIEQTIL
jgi:hypothetical protein